MDYNYTSSIEDELDEISHGNLKWKDVLKTHYNQLNTKINNINKDIKVKPKMLKKILKYKGVSYELRKNNFGYLLTSENDRIYITEEIDERARCLPTDKDAKMVEEVVVVCVCWLCVMTWEIGVGNKN